MTFKKYPILIPLIIVLFVSAVFNILYFDNSDKIADNGKSSKTNADLSEKTSKNLGRKNIYLVKRVIDGDTIELEDGERVRYIGIDTPETVDPRKPVQCFGKEASLANRELVGEKSVRLEKDVSEKDKYGRLLRYVYQGDKFINLELVKNGYAYAYTYPPDVKNSKLFLEAQKVAREARLGLWGNCSEKK